MPTTTAALILLATLSLDMRRALPYVEAVEVNHVTDAAGRECFCQVVVWCPNRFQGGRLTAVHWHLAENPVRVCGPPRGRCYVGTRGIVETDRVVETWTRWDPEVLDRAVWPVELRDNPFPNK